MDEEREDPRAAVDKASRLLKKAGFDSHIILVENADKSVVGTTMGYYETIRYLVAGLVDAITKLDSTIAAREAQEN